MKYYKLKVLKDNYIWLLITNKVTLAIDCGCSKSLLTFVNKFGLSLDYILITHAHSDHIDGLVEVIDQTSAKIICGLLTKELLPMVIQDRIIVYNTDFKLAEIDIKPIATPGHTEDHTCFYFSTLKWLFSGDTLFTLGCGRAFYSLKLLYESIQKIKNICSKDSLIFPGHNYSENNLNFINSINYIDNAYRVEKRYKKFSIPSTLSLELQYNPFLNVDNPIFKKSLNKGHLSDYEFFAYLRELKDNFKTN